MDLTCWLWIEMPVESKTFQKLTLSYSWWLPWPTLLLQLGFQNERYDKQTCTEVWIWPRTDLAKFQLALFEPEINVSYYNKPLRVWGCLLHRKADIYIHLSMEILPMCVHIYTGIHMHTYSWSLNNTCLTCAGPLRCGYFFFFINAIRVL